MKKKQLHKSNWLVTMLLLVMAILMPYGGAWAQTASQPSEGNGSEGSPYIITKAEELAWFRDAVNDGNYEICAKIADNVEVIDLKDFCHAADASQNLKELSWEPIGNSDWSYVGTFDGNGKTITNLYINATQAYMGLFGRIYKSTIKNLTFENANVTNTENDIGILAGYAGNGNTLQNIKISNTCQIKGGNDFTGGIAGYLDGNAYNCVNYATVQGTEDVGGLVGYFESGTIKDCANYGDITGTSNVGNLIGNAYTCNLNNVLGTGNVTATNTKPGGILVGIIENSSGSTASGILAYSSSAKLTINGTEQAGDAVKAIGDGSLAYPEGKNEADVIKAFNPEQLNSGEVAWLLNGSTSVPTEGSTLAWYQTLGENGDEYPVLTPKDGNTVYYIYCTCVDKQLYIYSNTENEKYDKYDKGTETLLTNGLYSSTCQRCQANFMYIKDFCGIDGNDLELTANTDGSYTAVKPVDIKDNAAYDSPVDFSAPTLNYTRNFGGTNWTTWYVPFELTLTPELCQKYAFSRINNVHQYDDNNDGKADRTIVESFNQTEGVTLKANYPYLVRALTDADKAMTITLTEAELAKAESKHIECMSVDYTYTFTGIYNEMGDSGSEANSPLSLFDYSAGNKWLNFHSLPAQRHHLVITPRDGSAQTMAPARVILQVIGDETVTGIVNIYSHDKRSSETYDLSGRRVGSNQRGLLIKNGKKVLIK